MELFLCLVQLCLYFIFLSPGAALPRLDHSEEGSPPCSDSCSVYICQNLWDSLHAPIYLWKLTHWSDWTEPCILFDIGPDSVNQSLYWMVS